MPCTITDRNSACVTFNPLPHSLTLLAPCLYLSTACSGTPTYNPTTFPYQMAKEWLDKEDQDRGDRPCKPGHAVAQLPGEGCAAIDAAVSAYLKENGFKVLPQRKFEQHWNAAVRAFGNPVDPTSGKVNMKTFAQIMHTVRDEMRKIGKPRRLYLHRPARIPGAVQRRPEAPGALGWCDPQAQSLQGPGSGVSADFDWNMQAAVASLQVSIYDTRAESPVFRPRRHRCHRRHRHPLH